MVEYHISLAKAFILLTSFTPIHSYIDFYGQSAAKLSKTGQHPALHSVKLEFSIYKCIGVKFVNTIKVLPDVTCYLTTFVQKSQKSLHIKLLTRSSLPIWKLYRVNNPKLTEILPQYIRNLNII